MRAVSALLMSAVFAVCSQKAVAESTGGSGGWKLFNCRLGMFVHWGIYSVDGYHEQQRMRMRMDRREYERRAARFTAKEFDAESVVDAAESLGAEYIVFTSKHHDGFCMWNTKTTAFNVMNTPAKRDIVGELAAACSRRRMKLGLYYSNPDWHNPNAYNPLSTHQVPPEDGDMPDMESYRKYVKAQISELLSNYGEIVCLFWDIPTMIHAPEMNELVRSLQPGIAINDRGWGDKGDYSTPERGIADGAAFTNLTEACDSVGVQSWGYRVNEDYRTLGYITRSIDRVLARGGNFLLNIGPMADGRIPDETLSLLKRTGDWFRNVRASYCNCVVDSTVRGSDDVTATRCGNVLYLHYARGLPATGVKVSPFSDLPRRVVLMNTGGELKAELTVLPNDWENHEQALHIYGIPADRLSNESVIIQMCL